MGFVSDSKDYIKIPTLRLMDPSEVKLIKPDDQYEQQLKQKAKKTKAAKKGAKRAKV